MQALNRAVALATSRNDVVLAILIVSIIFMMILPLPTTLVDVLIGANMTISAVLLMVALYLPSPLAFSSFPSVLLVTTLFRLGISIATTRLILLQGDAGHIIETFGNFVVGGNLVVGLVVFLILTIVQFVVITKGAERVAEVAARFSLDAMPGKQMSIDADLRAGTIDMDEARRRRTIVEKESQLYGAMDGAMKFVKGDAIAGLIIVAVNLLGGMLIGTMQRGLTAGEAVQVYSILSIGDGLISQIPALFIAICAGIIVTRVQTGEGGPSNVGKDIGAQVLAQPRALLIAAAIAVGMGLIPGMPTFTFLALGAIVGTVGFVLLRGTRKVVDEKTGEITEIPALAADGQPAPAKPKTDGSAEFAPTLPLMIDVAAGLQKHFNPDELNEELLKIRRALYFDLGVPFPGIQLRFNEALTEQTYNILLSEVPVSQGRLRPGHVLARDSEQNLQALQVPYEADKRFLPDVPTLWVADAQLPTLSAAGIPYLDAHQVLTWHLAFVLKKYSSDFIGIQETRFLLSAMEDRYPDLVKEALRVMPVQKVAEIMQRLVSEDISVRNLRTVLEALIEWGQKEKDSVLLTEYVRVSLKRHISYKYSSGQNILPAYLLAPNVEETVRGAVRQTSAGSYLALDPNVSKRLLENIKRTVGDLSAAARKPVLLTSMDIRRYLRKMIEQDLYDLPVLSYQELTQEINVQPLARVDL
ncbi:EscV/YscV/HrcV family type III secretion system export apparatus protein [Bordetella genomosp. 1]|uniref:EscV/YscV/HrcV family type III secretion system export apparatus protein n=1 Tax=Bordetella genomosp. 1 TaxID=1395607 RepID=A0A261S6T7_9BORD|nr:type III secretion system export apparatus subunit SctV [Bordetella genomosp. 1]OZI33094.1 EscV/YscV/HrcV family type III secretion system export apparatus protein [Bordetella genomosp. 1]OZI57199.1 EscV/YscV/HrcV family type III secretion system export apparatus protein [Bordetella genomosp. 1]